MENKKIKDEFIDLYNKDRIPLGKVQKRKDPIKPGEYFLVVCVCIFNSKNQLLIQQRQPFKKGWPNMWDLSASGGVLAGETSSQAAERETFEEIGVKVDLSSTRPAFTFNFDRGFEDFYFVEMDIDIDTLSLEEEEVQRVKWADKEEVLKMQKQGTMIPYFFIDKIFDGRKYKDAYGDVRSIIDIKYADKPIFLHG